jgi:hypothetical protein
MIGGILLASSAHADVIVSTITGTGPGVTPPAWSGNTGFASWGPVGSGSATVYGETFTPPAGNPVFTGMTFEISNQSGSAIPFQAYVYAWNGAITGPALFTSVVLSDPSMAGFVAFTVTPPPLTLTPGNEYIAFFSTIGEGGSSSASAIWGDMQNPPLDNAYSGGTFEQTNTTTFANLSNSAFWSTPGNDLAFAFSFSPAATGAPEPSSVLLVAAGIGLFGVLARRKRA